MKRMSKSMRREVAQLLPTSKRLRIIKKKALERMSDVCYVNNECCELIEMEKKTTDRYNATNIIMISDNLSYIMKYIESLSRMHGEIAESCKEIKEILNTEQDEHICPLLLRTRFNRMVYVSILLRNVISEMCDIHEEIGEEFKVLLKDKILNAIHGLSDSELYAIKCYYKNELGMDF